MENNKNKKSVKFQGDMLNFCDFIQVFVFTRNHHLKGIDEASRAAIRITKQLQDEWVSDSKFPREEIR